jgi:hypothetical protein
MNKKFASKFKSEADSALYSNEPEFYKINNVPDENSYEYKFNKMTLLFPSIPKEKIEQILNDHEEISLEQGIEILKQMIINENKKNEINNNAKLNNNNNIINIHLTRKRYKRNYISLLTQTQANMQPHFPLNNNMNTINNNINAINNGTETNSRTDIFFDKNKEKVKEEERKKLELKTVDKATEEILESKNQDDLKKYLFNQLVLLEDKKDKERKIQKMMKEINNLEKDYPSLKKCLLTIIRPVNKNNSKINKLDNKIKELKDEIDKVTERIKYYECVGNFLLNMQKMQILDLN